MKNLIMTTAAFLAFGYASAQTDPTSGQPRTSTGAPTTGQGSQPGQPGMEQQTIPADTAHTHTTNKSSGKHNATMKKNKKKTTKPTTGTTKDSTATNVR